MTPERPPHVGSSADLPAGRELLGGKGENLARLGALGLPVPPWYAVTTAAFRDALFGAGLGARIDRCLADLSDADGNGLAEAARQIRDWILGMTLPAELERRIAEVHESSMPREEAVAVRSSAADEDGRGGSFSGLHQSVLGVRGSAAVTGAVKRVWASAYYRQALAYRLKKGLPLSGIDMAVLVQRMVPARSSGVLFTADPASGDVHRMIINAAYGLGEGVVEGEVEADRFSVDKETLEIEAAVVSKSERLVDAGKVEGELLRAPVAEEERGRSSLSDEEIRALARLAQSVERHFKRPQDIEFALGSEGEIALLQSRPITTLEEDGPAAGHPLEWSNAAWVENLSDVVSPMTMSVTRRTGSLAGRFLIDLLNVDRRVAESRPELFELPVGYIRGRLYLRRGTLAQILPHVPGAGFHPRLIAAFLGVRQPGLERPKLSRARRYLVELPAFVRLGFRLLSNLRGSPGRSARFEEYARGIYNRCAATDFAALGPHEMVDFYTGIERQLAPHWRAPQINGLYAKAYFSLMKKLCRAWCKDKTGSLPNELLRGEEGLRSLEPVHQQLRLARMVRRDPELFELLTSRPAEEVAELVRQDGRFAPFAKEVEAYIDAYFFKCDEEMKLEAPSLRDRPAQLYQTLARYASAYGEEDLDVEAHQERERAARREAERRAFTALGRSIAGPLRRAIFRRVMQSARLGMKYRENLKFGRLQMIGLFRELIRTLGAKMTEAGIFDTPEDIFLLTLEEVFDYIRGAAPTCDLRGLAALRRGELETYRGDEAARVPDESFTTYGMVYHRNRYKRRHHETPALRDGVLRGRGAFRGTVTATVRVVETPDEDVQLAGEILAVPTVRTSWAVYFPVIGGLLIERGEVLSHTATLAREMGIPTIVGIPGLMAHLRSGQRVKMDGASGTVEILD